MSQMSDAVNEKVARLKLRLDVSFHCDQKEARHSAFVHASITCREGGMIVDVWEMNPRW